MKFIHESGRSSRIDASRQMRSPLRPVIFILLSMFLVAGSVGLLACQKQAELPNTTVSSVDVQKPAATDSSTTTQKTYKIGFVVNSSFDTAPYLQAIQTGIEDFIANPPVSYTREDANATGSTSSSSKSTTQAITSDVYKAKKFTTEAYVQAAEDAIDDGCTIVVLAGGDCSEAAYTLQSKYAGVMFLLVDGQPRSSDGSVNVASNMHCVVFRNDQLGYLVGYALVKNGYTSIAFAGGKENEDVVNLGYGFLAGADAAAAELGISDDLDVRYWYSDTFTASSAVQSHVAAWYKSGVQAVFACGGGIYSSVLKAAEANDGYMVGVDVDQASLGEQVVTSAVKNLSSAVTNALAGISWTTDGTWSSDYAGQTEILGATENAIGLATGDSWRLENFTEDDYAAALAALADGTVKLSVNVSARPALAIDVTYDATGTTTSISATSKSSGSGTTTSTSSSSAISASATSAGSGTAASGASVASTETGSQSAA